MKLVIVESPSKAKTINKYLGKDYIVTSSVGHIRDIPKSNKNAIDIEAGFVPHYEISKGKQRVVSDLIKKAKRADEVILATDPDREGEAISWHLAEILKDNLGKDIEKKIERVTFNEITESAVKEAIENPRSIDQKLRQAQEARRVLDRLVGYDLSGLIWKKVRYGLSAGRVQSPALRILMEREREIRAFIPDDYYVITGDFKKGSNSFQLICDSEPGKEEEANRIVSEGKKGTWNIVSVKETSQKRKPYAPFTTSTLQQTASTRLGMSPSRTMSAAQKLYEAGYITYMRTDSTTLSKQALGMLAGVIEKEFGKDFVEIKQFQSKSKNAQEAHEAIRPTKPMQKSAGATEDQKNLYRLIWTRAVSSQMVSADILKTKISANITNGDIPNFSINGSRVMNPGWLLCDTAARGEDVELPKLSEGDHLDVIDIVSEQKWTQPPNRYSEAGLIKELEKRGIGRPSTYASIIRTLEERGYVNKENRTLLPTDTGDVVSSFLEEHFIDYIDDDFTAKMEDDLDEIALGNKGYVETLEAIYKPFYKHVTSKQDIEKLTNLGPADRKFSCPKCGSAMVIKLGRGGKFLSCSQYPDCDGSLTLEGKELGDVQSNSIGKHPDTGEDIYLLDGRFGHYVQLGPTPEDKKAPKPKRASLPRNKKPENVTLDDAVHYLALPRELGSHPDDNEPVFANIGRFGPYVGHGKNFRSLKKSSGLDPYTITLEQALAELNKPKALPKGTELVKDLGKHPKTGKDIRILKSKSGLFVQKGLKRVYLPDDFDAEKATIEDIVAIMAVEEK